MDRQKAMTRKGLKGVVLAALVCGIFIGVRGTAIAGDVIQRHGGLTLNGNLELADGKTVADGVILMTHSLIQHNGREPIPYVQALFQEHGYNSLAINYSLALDNRRGSFDCRAPHRHTLDASLEEIGIWVQWLKAKGAKKLILLGHSYGGNEIARYAANNDEPAIAGVILLGPGTVDHRAWSPQGYKIRYGKDLNGLLERAELLVAAGRGDTMMEDVDFLFCPQATVSAAAVASYYRVAPKRLLPNLMKEAKKPTLFIAASEDNRMADLNRLVKPFIDGDRTQLVVIDGAGHFFLDLFADDAVEQAVEFFNKTDF